MVTTGAVGREVSPRYLSEDERVQIVDLRQGGAGVRAIAERLGRSPSKIARRKRRGVAAVETVPAGMPQWVQPGAARKTT